MPTARNLALPNLDARTSAIRQLVREAPASIVAGMFGYHPATAEALAAKSGATWKRYAAGTTPNVEKDGHVMRNDDDATPTTTTQLKREES